MLNGFALVFSIAALCAVTWGPSVLIWCRVSGWRTRVVNVGLAHMAVSLASVLGAFACAGFVVASVGAPELTCGNLKCTEGGVPCSTFSTRSTSILPSWQPSYYVLDPVIAKLNNATFTNLKGRSALGGSPAGAGGDGQDVVCHSYSHIAVYSDLVNMAKEFCAGRCVTPFNGLHGNGTLDDADGRPVSKTCFMLVDPASFNYGFSQNPFTYWCSLNGSGLGPGWLPLQLEAAARLLMFSGPGMTQSDAGLYRNSNDNYDIKISEGQGISVCPTTTRLEKLATPFMPQRHQHGFAPTGIELLINSTPVAGSDGPCVPSHETHYISAIKEYVYALGGTTPTVRTCRITLVLGPDPEAGRGRLSKAAFNHDTLVSYYPALQYQCSQMFDGVLCDYTIDPPLSVDAGGSYLNKKSLSKQSTANVYVTSQTTASVEYAVIAMLAVAFVAILGTLAMLGGVQLANEGLHYVWASLHKRVISTVGWCLGPAH